MRSPWRLVLPLGFAGLLASCGLDAAYQDYLAWCADAGYCGDAGTSTGADSGPSPDAAVADAGPDAGTGADGGSDAGPVPDAGSAIDAGTDSGVATSDSGTPDAGPADSGASTEDSGAPDAGACATWQTVPSCSTGMFPSFQQLTLPTSSDTPQAVAVGDFNRDGWLDLLYANSGANKISLFLNGGGSFGTGTEIPGSGDPQALAVGDLDGDGALDFVTANPVGSSITAFLNTGTGNFAGAVQTISGANPQGVTVADLDGDGKLDIAAADGQHFTTCGSGPQKVFILKNGGGGSFSGATAIGYDAGCAPVSLSAADFFASGQSDLSVANFSSASASILDNVAGQFTAQTQYGAGGNPRGVASGDLNGDGWPDLVVAADAPPYLTVLMNQRNGGFASGSLPSSAGDDFQGVALADFNGDGALDIGVANWGGKALTLFLNQRDGGFARVNFAVPSGVYKGTTEGPTGIAVGDFNHDGAPDVALAVTDTLAVVGFNQCVAPTTPCQQAEACIPVGSSCDGGVPCCNFNACSAGHCN